MLGEDLKPRRREGGKGHSEESTVRRLRKVGLFLSAVVWKLSGREF